MIFSTISELNVASIEPIFLAACAGLTNKVFFPLRNPARFYHCCGWRGFEGSLKLIASDHRLKS